MKAGLGVPQSSEASLVADLGNSPLQKEQRNVNRKRLKQLTKTKTQTQTKTKTQTQTKTKTDTETRLLHPPLTPLRKSLFDPAGAGTTESTTASALAVVTAEKSALEALGLSETSAGQYQRVQRVRAKKATAFVQRTATLSNLITSAISLAPIEGVLPQPKHGKCHVIQFHRQT